MLRDSKTNSDNISPVEIVQVRRINRDYHIARKGNVIEAILYTRKEEKENVGNYDVLLNSSHQTLEIRKEKGIYFARLYYTSHWKRSYWRKWRKVETASIEASSKNFNDLLREVKTWH